jgi:hypothetical protein
VFVGTPGTDPRRREHDRAKVRIAPSFCIKVAADMAAAFASYLGPNPNNGMGPTGQFFSNLAGTAAVPGAPPDNHVGEVIEFQPANGGVALIGGRISFLTLHNCSKPANSDADGAAEFLYVAGGGLDIVEPIAVSVSLHDCALRGVSVTRDKTDRKGSPVPGAGRIRFRANDSFLVFVCFVGDVGGTADLSDSTLWGILNASGMTSDIGAAATLRLTVSGSRHQFVVNAQTIVDSIEDSKANEPPPYFELLSGNTSVFSSRGPSNLAAQLESMDYRREPEEREMRQRHLWARGGDVPIYRGGD